MTRSIVSLVAIAWLAGCKLVDQTTFGAAPTPPSPDQLSLALLASSGIPLVVMRGDATDGLTADTLRQAVDLAEARRPGANYNITTVVPAAGSLDQQISATEQAQQRASDVMVMLSDLGVAPQRIHLLAHTDPSVTAREIRIYVH